MVWFCGGHGVCLTGSGEAGHIEHAVLSWLGRYLKRDTSVQTGPRFEWLADDAKWRSAADYPLTKRGSLTAITGQKTLPIAPTSPSGGLIAATPAVNAAEVALPAASGPAHILGEPTLKLTYSGLAVPGATHVYAQIVDGSGHVVGNQATPIPVTLDGLTHTIERPLEAIASEAVAGSELQAADHAGDHAVHAAALGGGGHVRADRDLAADRGLGIEDVQGEGGRDQRVRGVDQLRHAQLGRHAHQDVGGLALEAVLGRQPAEQLEQRAAGGEVEVEQALLDLNLAWPPQVADGLRPMLYFFGASSQWRHHLAQCGTDFLFHCHKMTCRGRDHESLYIRQFCLP